jgi:hypothetical protein
MICHLTPSCSLPPNSKRSDEEMQYSIKKNPDMIALEARCFKCGLCYSIGLNILEYRDKILHANGKPFTLTGCRCNEDNSIIVPIIK